MATGNFPSNRALRHRYWAKDCMRKLADTVTNAQDVESAAQVVATEGVSRTDRKNGNNKTFAKRCLALYDLGG